MYNMTLGFRTKLDKYVNLNSSVSFKITSLSSRRVKFFCIALDDKEQFVSEQFISCERKNNFEGFAVSGSFSNNSAEFKTDFSKFASGVKKVWIGIYGSDPAETTPIECRAEVMQNGQAQLQADFSGINAFKLESAVVLLSLYFKDGWRLANAAQGYNGGIEDMLARLNVPRNIVRSSFVYVDACPSAVSSSSAGYKAPAVSAPAAQSYGSAPASGQVSVSMGSYRKSSSQPAPSNNYGTIPPAKKPKPAPAVPSYNQPAPSNNYGTIPPAKKPKPAPAVPSYNQPAPSNNYGTIPPAKKPKLAPAVPSYNQPVPSNNYGAIPPAKKPKPAPAYRAPANNYNAPAPSYGAPANNYNAPAPSYGAPANNYNAPAPSYGAPANNYNAPAPSYGAPANNYNAPAPSYGAPANNYNAPAPSYGAPANNYSAPAPSYGAPANNYNAPAPSYGAPANNYSAPAPAQPAKKPVRSYADFCSDYNKNAPKPTAESTLFGLLSTGSSSSSSSSYSGSSYSSSPAQTYQPVQSSSVSGGGGICPSCGAKYIAGSRFCDDCGTPLPETASAAPASAPVPQPIQAAPAAPAPVQPAPYSAPAAPAAQSAPAASAGPKISCPVCGGLTLKGLYCDECGASLSQAPVQNAAPAVKSYAPPKAPSGPMVVCPACSNSVPQDKFCCECGVEMALIVKNNASGAFDAIKPQAEAGANRSDIGSDSASVPKGLRTNLRQYINPERPFSAEFNISSGPACSFACLCLDSRGKIYHGSYFVSEENKFSPQHEIEGQVFPEFGFFNVNFAALPADIIRVIFVTGVLNGSSASSLDKHSLIMSQYGAPKAVSECFGREMGNAKTIVSVELTRTNGDWEVFFANQGYNEDLASFISFRR